MYICHGLYCKPFMEYSVVISWILDLTLIGMFLLIMLIILMFYFILGQRPHCIWTWWFFYISGVSQLLMIYVYAYLCWAWTLKHMISEMFCAKWGALEHLSNWWIVLSEKLSSTLVLTFVLRKKLWNTQKDIWSVGNKPWSLPCSYWT